METITSIKDPRIIEARALTSSRERNEAGKYLVEGKEAIAWALEAHVPIEHVFCCCSASRRLFY